MYKNMMQVIHSIIKDAGLVTVSVRVLQMYEHAIDIRLADDAVARIGNDFMSAENLESALWGLHLNGYLIEIEKGLYKPSKFFDNAENLYK